MQYSSTYIREDGGGSPPFAAVHADLFDPLSQKSIKISAKVDTGFSGSLLIPLTQYVELGLQAYEEPEMAISGRRATGAPISLRASKGIIKLGSYKIGCFVYTTPVLMRPLLGRELLKLWRTILDGPKEKLDIRG